MTASTFSGPNFSYCLQRSLSASILIGPKHMLNHLDSAAIPCQGEVERNGSGGVREAVRCQMAFSLWRERHDFTGEDTYRFLEREIPGFEVTTKSLI